MEKLQEYLKDLERQHEIALAQVYKIEGAIQAIKYVIQEAEKPAESASDGKGLQ